MNLRDYILQRCEELKRQQLKPALQDPLIAGLLRLLPPIGAPFPRSKQWVYALSTILAILYPEEEQIPS